MENKKDIRLYIIFEKKADKQLYQLELPTEDKEIDETFESIKGYKYNVKFCFSNTGLALLNDEKELKGFKSIKNRNLTNITHKDGCIFKTINKTIKEINSNATMEEVRALTDFITTDVEEILELVKRKKYKVIPYKNDNERGTYYSTAENLNNLILGENHFRTSSGFLEFFDDEYKKEFSGNEFIYKWPDDFHKEQMCILVDDYKYGTCSICGQPYSNWGNNPDPVNYGRCCDMCQEIAVMPTRFLNYDIAKSTVVRRIRY